MSKNKKALGAAALASASLLVFGATSASAAVTTTGGTVMIGTKAYSMDYLLTSDPAKIAALRTEIQAAGDKIYYNLDDQKGWKDIMAASTATGMTEDDLATKLGATSVTYVKGDGTTETETLGTQQALSVSSVSAIKAKSLNVTFNGAVDPTKAVIKVTKNGFAVNQSAAATFAADNKSATINLAAKMTAGDYTVTVTGLTTNPISGTVTVKDESISKITLGDNAVLDRADSTNKTVKLAYTVYNQYGEDITATNPTLAFSTGRGTFSPASGVLTITDTVAFAAGDKIAVTALEANSSTFASNVVTVAPKAQVSDISISKLFNYVDSTKVLAADSTSGEFKLAMSFKDQYGNTMNTTSDVANILADTVFTVSDTSKANVLGGAAAPTLVSEKIDGVDTITLKLDGPLSAGTTTVTAISKSTGHRTTFDIVVKAASKVDTLTFTTPDVAVAGEKIDIPVTAVDQFGQAITTSTAMTSGMTSALTATDSLPVAFKQDYVKGTTYVELNATSETTAKTIMITGITGTGKLVNLSISLKAPKLATVITGTESDFITNVAKTGVTNLSADLIDVADQYNRAVSPTLGSGSYVYKVTTSDPTIMSVNGNATDYIKADTDVLPLTGVAKGSASITITLYKWTDAAHGATPANSTVDADELTLVPGSAYTFNAKVVEKADIQSYALDDFDKLLDVSGGTHDVALNVEGTLADGSKVVVPQPGYYTVAVSDGSTPYVSYNSTTGKLVSITGYTWGTATERTVPVTVTVDGATTTALLTKNVTVSNVAPFINALSLKNVGSIGNALQEAPGVISVNAADADTQTEINLLAADVVKSVDQYGVSIPTAFSSVTVTNLGTKDLTAAGANKLVAGDTYTVTAITANGKTIQFKVILK